MAGKFGRQIMALLLVMLLMASFTVLTSSAEDETEAPDTHVTVNVAEGVSITYDKSTATYSEGVFTTGQTTSGCQGNSQVEAIITINKEISNNVLVFNYSATIASGGSLIIGGGEPVTDYTGAVTVASNETSKEIKIKSGTDTGASSVSSISFSGFELFSPTFVGVLFKGENGTLDVDFSNAYDYRDAAYWYEYKILSTDGLPITVTPDPGYSFIGFINSSTNVIQEYTNGILYPEKNNIAISPVFVRTGIDQVYSVGNKLFTSFQDAEEESRTNNTVMIPLQDFVLPEGDYTLNSGAKLLIPLGESKAFVGNEPDITFGSYTVPTAYRTITMASGANLIIQSGASVSLASKLSASMIGGGEWNGCPTGPDGRINMLDGSKITVNSGGTLYSWGYIYGSGEVEANSGAKVYEALQIKDWCGSNVALNIRNYTQMFSQYYIQNIEVPLKLYNGAVDHLCTAIYGDLTNNAVLLSSSLNGTDGNGFFKQSNGYIIKDYIEDEDRIEYQMYGDVSLGTMTLSGWPLLGSIASNDSYLVITSNMTINVVDSHTFTVNQPVKMLPGAVINIENDSNMAVSSGKNLLLYDKYSWGNYTATGRIYPVGYSVANGTTTMRDESDLVDAKIDINGTVTVNGKVYTSPNGADITSSQGTGIYVVNTAPGNSSLTVYECVLTENTPEEGETLNPYDLFTYTKTQAAPFSPAQLHNSGTSYTFTAEVAAGTVFYYDIDIPVWHSQYLTKWFDTDGTTLLEFQQDSAGTLSADSISPGNMPSVRPYQELKWEECGEPKSDESRKVKAYKADIIENRYSLTLGGEIGVNFYIPKGAVDDVSGVKIKLSWGPDTGVDHGEAEFNVSEITSTNNVKYHASDKGLNTHNPIAKAVTYGDYYKLTAYVAAKQMADDISVKIYNSGNTVIKTDSYRVADYCYKVINDSEGTLLSEMQIADPSMDAEKFAKLQELCKAMLTYGAQAQTQFSYNTGNPADKDLEGYTYTPANASEFEAYGSDAYMSDVGDMTFYGSSMLLEAETTYSLWFRYENAGYEPPAATATIGGKTFTVEKMKIEGDYDAYYVRYNILNLPANLLAEDITVSFGGTEKTYNAKTYFYLALARSGDATLIDTINSLYNYNRSAVTFFN